MSPSGWPIFSKIPRSQARLPISATAGRRFYLTLTPVPADPASAFILVNTTRLRRARSARLTALGSISTRTIPKRDSRSSGWPWERWSLGMVDVEISGPDRDRLLALQRQVRDAVAGGARHSRQRGRLGQQDRQGHYRNQPGPGRGSWASPRRKSLNCWQDLFHRLRRSRSIAKATTPFRSYCAPDAATHSQSLEGLTSATFPKNGELISLAQIATLRAGVGFFQDPPQEPGAYDHRNRPQRLDDGWRVAEG